MLSHAFSEDVESPGSGDQEAGGSDTVTYGLCSFLEGSTYFKESCVKIFTQEMAWEEAKTFCPDTIALSTLIEPDSLFDVNSLYNILVSATIDSRGQEGLTAVTGVWLGARRDAPDVSFKWATSGKDVVEIPSAVTVEERTFSSDSSGDDASCLEITSGGKVSATECGNGRMVMCSIEVNPICQEPERYYDGYCYLYMDDLGDYQQAKETCERADHEMVEIHTSDAMLFIQDLLREKMWWTVNYVRASGDSFMEMSEHGVTRSPGSNLCFLVKGHGSARMVFYKDESNVGVGNCPYQAHLELSRSSTTANVKFHVCNSCLDTCLGDPDPVTLLDSSPGHEFSFYCVNQKVKDRTFTLETLTLEGVMDSHTLNHLQVSVEEFNSIKVTSSLMTYQWKFPLNSFHSIYLGADLEEEEWESGVPIDYKLLGLRAAYSPGTDRLMMESHHAGFEHSDGSLSIPVLCRSNWGDLYYYGVIPQTSGTRWLYLSHETSALALFNHQPRAVDILTQTLVTTLSRGQSERVSLDSLDPDDDDMDGCITFVVRTADPITVELFSFSPTHASSTLVLPDTMTQSHYVITVPNNSKGEIVIMNHREPNKFSLQIPNFRRVSITIGGNTYRAYHVTTEELDPMHAMTVEFEGDVTGTIVSGTSKMSVFVATTSIYSQDRIEGDVSVDQLIPASKTGSEYPVFNLSHSKLHTAAVYKMAALFDQTYIRIPGIHGITLTSYGDYDIITAMTSHMPQVMTSSKPFYATVGFSDGTMRCSSTLIPPNFWRSVYVINLTSQQLGGDDVTLYVLIASSTAQIGFVINGEVQVFDCHVLGSSRYYSCFYDLMLTHYVIEASSTGQTFAAYVIAAYYKSKCYCRPAGIQHSEAAINDYEAPPLEEPEECPNNPSQPSTQEPPSTSGPNLCPTTEPADSNPNPTTQQQPDPPPTAHPPTLPDPPSPPRHPYVNVTLTQDILDEIQEKVREELKIDVHKVSSFTRKKISAPDDRTSSRSMGYVGVVLITMVTVFIVVTDAVSLVSWTVNKMAGMTT